MIAQSLLVHVEADPFNAFIHTLFNRVHQDKQEITNISEPSSTLKNKFMVFYKGQVKIVPISDLWFWSEKWQQLEEKVNNQLKTGEYKDYDNFDDFFNELG